MTEQNDRREKRDALAEAAEWYFRRDAGPLSPRDEAAFRDWISSPQNSRAYARLDSTWEKLGQLPHSAPAVRTFGRGSFSRQAIAASVAVLAIFGIGYVYDLPMRLQADALTGRGEVQTITMADGSEILLNSDTAVAFEYTPEERRIRLLRGEAIFRVAKEQPVRPFVVAATDGEARALGTAFAVRESDDATVVTVLESRVEVVCTVCAPGAKTTVELNLDQTVALGAAGMGNVEPINANDALAWQRGKLVFEDRPLRSVIEELNRYHPGRIQITDAAVGNHRVSGVFDTKDPIAVVDALEGSLGLKSTRLTNYLILLHL
ncbi:FecR family protein [Hyphomicrobium sp. D-2]|uniref:FecR family protein n=1 Tax=Hyphomicrobium sp. D-2 TaxID=3041621 RepID=UPI002457BAC0|nr:FecR family protein [Hyphomicrobium sp. D-2]MDH4982126.1 FecR family protein [Hyphomicrobium sp. D-2]